MGVRSSVPPLIVGLLGIAACDPGDVVLLAPQSGGAGGPVIQIRAVLDTAYAGLAAALGWGDGVPGADVQVHRIDEPYDESYWTAGTTDTLGLATFPDLLAGLYEVAVTRRLDATDVARVGEVTRLVAGGRRLRGPAALTQAVTIAPATRGSLVLSEVETSPHFLDAKYLELYNNADTTIYLDGKYIGRGWWINRDYVWFPCELSEDVRNDPAGVWTEQILRFPGRGTDYPLAPGRTAVLAKSAVDHRPVRSGLYDLSDADFEWGGYYTADEPDVPNLEDIGLRPMNLAWPGCCDTPVFLSEPVPLETLPRYVDLHSGYTSVRIPAAAILDYWVGMGDQRVLRYTYASCLEAAHRSIERLPGPGIDEIADFDAGLSVQRRILSVLPDGRKILQDANTSMVDFVKAPRTPGWIPDSLP